MGRRDDGLGLIALAWERPIIGGIISVIMLCAGAACGSLAHSKDIGPAAVGTGLGVVLVLIGAVGLLVSFVGFIRNAFGRK